MTTENKPVVLAIWKIVNKLISKLEVKLILNMKVQDGEGFDPDGVSIFFFDNKRRVTNTINIGCIDINLFATNTICTYGELLEEARRG